MSEDYFEMDVAAYLLKQESDRGNLAFDQVEEAGMALSQYYERVRQQRRRPFSALLERLEQQRQSVREMFRTKPDGLDAAGNGSDDLELDKLMAPLPATPMLRRQIANVAQFALDSGEDVETVSAGYASYLKGYAVHEMGRESATDDEVYEHIAAKHDLRDHLKAAAWQMGVLGERPSRAYRAWASEARKEKLKGWQPGKVAEYEKLFLDQHQAARTATEGARSAGAILSSVAGVGFMPVPGRPEPLVKGVDGSLAVADEDGMGFREVAKPDPYRGLVITDVHQAHRVVDEAGDMPVYMPNQVPADALKRDQDEAARGIARLERPSGRPGMAPILEETNELAMERPYDFKGNTRLAETSIGGTRARNEQHYRAEGKRHGAFVEMLQKEVVQKRLEIYQQCPDEAQRSAELQRLRESAQERYVKHLEEKEALLTSAHFEFENGLLSAQTYQQMGEDLGMRDLLESYQDEVAMREKYKRALDVAWDVALGRDGGEPHIQITPEYREAYAKVFSEPPRIFYGKGRGTRMQVYPGKTSEEVERIAKSWRGPEIVMVDTVERRLAKLNERFATEIAASHHRMREALGPILDYDEGLIAAYESQAVFDSAGQLPKGVLELLTSPRFWAERAPYAGGFVEIGYLASVAASAEKLTRGEQMSDAEAIMLREALIEMNRENSWWGDVLDLTVSSASFGVELGTSGGIGTAAKKGAMGLAALGLRRLAAKEGRQEVEKLLLTRLVLGTVGLAGQTATASASHVLSKAYKDSAPFDHLEMLRGPDGKVIIGLEAGYEAGSPWEKLKGAFIHQMVENGSERLGGFIKFPGAAKAFQKMSGPQQEAVVKEGLFQAFARKMGAEKAARFLGKANARLAKMEIQGMPQEVLEEYVAALGHTVFEGEEFSPPSFDDITKLMASLVISRSGSMAVEGVMGNDGGEGRMPAEVGVDGQVRKGAGGSAFDAEVLQSLGRSGEQQTAKVNAEAGGNAEGRLRFSGANAPRSSEERDDELADTFEMLRTDETSRRGAAVADKDLNVILQTMASRAETPETVRVDPNPPMRPETERSYVVTINEGGEVVVNVEKNGTVWVDTQGVRGGAPPRKAQGGDLVYQGGLNYAHSNGLVFVPDPREVKPIAQRRRISHMISSALRHGTTRHFNPYHADDINNRELPPRSEWREEKTEADFKHNLNLLLRAELKYVEQQMKDRGKSLADLRYDPNTDTVWQKQGGTDGGPSDWRQLSQKDYATLITGLDPGRSGIGETTLARALLAKVRLEGDATTIPNLESLPSEAYDRGGLPTVQPGSEIFRLRGTVQNPRKLFYSRGESSGSERVQRTGVTRAESTAAEARLKSTAQGRAIYDNVLIVDNRAALDGRQGRPGQQRYHAEDWDIMQDAEGFHDPRDGTVVLFRQNVRVLEGETAAQALARVVVHERVGHHGFDALRNSDSKFAEEWKKLAAAIPADRMKKLEEQYKHLNGDREALALEWFAHEVGNMGGRAQLEPGSVAQQMWQAMRDWVVRQLSSFGDPSKQMSQQVIDAHVRGLIRATQRSMVKRARGRREAAAHGSAATPGGPGPLAGGRTQFSMSPNEDHNPVPQEPTTDEPPAISNIDSNIPIPYVQQHGQGTEARRDAQAALGALLARAEDDDRANAQADAGERIRSESQSLVSWARESGWLIEPAGFARLTPSFQEFEGGAEHQVFGVPKAGRVMKITRPPNFGARGKLTDYLKNIKWSNALFQDDIRIEGVVETDKGPAVVISQSFVAGKSPKIEEVKAWFEKQGYQSAGENTWRHPDTGAMITDAHPRNFIITEDKALVPIDLQVLNPGRDILEQAKGASEAR